MEGESEGIVIIPIAPETEEGWKNCIYWHSYDFSIYL